MKDILAARVGGGEGGLSIEKGGGFCGLTFFFRPPITPFLDMPFPTIQ